MYSAFCIGSLQTYHVDELLIQTCHINCIFRKDKENGFNNYFRKHCGLKRSHCPNIYSYHDVLSEITSHPYYSQQTTQCLEFVVCLYYILSNLVVILSHERGEHVPCDNLLTKWGYTPRRYYFSQLAHCQHRLMNQLTLSVLPSCFNN